MKREEDHGECSSEGINKFHHHESYQEHLFLQQMHQHNAAAAMFPEVSPVLQPAWTVPPVHPFLPAGPVPYGGSSLLNRSSRVVPSSFQLAYDVASFGLQAELGKMTAQEIMDAKALAASKSHSEAERRRRERINNHLAKLRTLLPSTTKTDKASLLAEVIEHVKELKRQTSAIAESSAVPTEGDELTVAGGADEGGKFVIKASFCCEDRSDLLPELIKTLKAMRLRTVKAEITTVGGRVKNVLFITGEDNHDNDNNIMEEYSTTSFSGSEGENQQYFISSIEEALRAVMEKSSNNNGNGNDECGSVKRQRTNMSNILQHQHQHQQQQHRSL